MLEKKYKFVPEFFPNTNSYTIHRDCHVLEDGIEIAFGRHSMAFTCDMLEEMKKYIGDDNHDAVKSAIVMWTPAVVEAFIENRKAGVVAELKQRWPDLSEDKEQWSNEQRQVYNDYLNVKYHLVLKAE